MLNKDGSALAHFASEDGTYNGRTVITPKTKKSNTTRV